MLVLAQDYVDEFVRYWYINFSETDGSILQARMNLTHYVLLCLLQKYLPEAIHELLYKAQLYWWFLILPTAPYRILSVKEIARTYKQSFETLQVYRCPWVAKLYHFHIILLRDLEPLSAIRCIIYLWSTASAICVQLESNRNAQRGHNSGPTCSCMDSVFIRSFHRAQTNSNLAFSREYKSVLVN